MYKLLFLAIAVFLIVSSCSKETLQSEVVITTSQTWRCGLSGDVINESDLVGKWKTTYRGESHIDSLILQDDGTYMHTFVNENTGYYYESGWNTWWIEKRSDGGKYIHLNGMMYCGGATGTCIAPSDVGEFYDYCGDQWVDMNGEFILAVVRDTNVPRGIRLRHMKPIGYDAFFANYTVSNE